MFPRAAARFASSTEDSMDTMLLGPPSLVVVVVLLRERGVYEREDGHAHKARRGRAYGLGGGHGSVRHGEAEQKSLAQSYPEAFNRL